MPNSRAARARSPPVEASAPAMALRSQGHRTARSPPPEESAPVPPGYWESAAPPCTAKWRIRTGLTIALDATYSVGGAFRSRPVFPRDALLGLARPIRRRASIFATARTATGARRRLALPGNARRRTAGGAAGPVQRGRPGGPLPQPEPAPARECRSATPSPPSTTCS